MPPHVESAAAGRDIDARPPAYKPLHEYLARVPHDHPASRWP